LIGGRGRGRGYCFNIWRWDGNKYQHYANKPMEKGGCDWVVKINNQFK
jgi:hypothetical protein